MQIVVNSGGSKKKSEAVIFYNKPKVGVDVLDAMCRKYLTGHLPGRCLSKLYIIL